MIRLKMEGRGGRMARDDSVEAKNLYDQLEEIAFSASI